MIVQQSMRKAKAKAFLKSFLMDSIQVITVLFFVVGYSHAIDLSSIASAFVLWVVLQLVMMAYFILKTKE